MPESSPIIGEDPDGDNKAYKDKDGKQLRDSVTDHSIVDARLIHEQNNRIQAADEAGP